MGGKHKNINSLILRKHDKKRTIMRNNARKIKYGFFDYETINYIPYIIRKYPINKTQISDLDIVIEMIKVMSL